MRRPAAGKNQMARNRCSWQNKLRKERRNKNGLVDLMWGWKWASKMCVVSRSEAGLDDEILGVGRLHTRGNAQARLLILRRSRVRSWKALATRTNSVVIIRRPKKNPGRGRVRKSKV